MSFTPVYPLVQQQTYLNWVEIDLAVIDPTPDAHIVYQLFADGRVLDGFYAVSTSAETIRFPRAVLPGVFSIIAAKSTNNKAYIALAINPYADAVVTIYAVDQNGSTSGGGSGEYHVAGTVQINGVAAQRELVVISDNPAGREIIAEGESGGGGAFDVSYSGWAGAVIVVALDEYGSLFPASTPLNAGAVVHPTTPNGYVYVVTEAGTTGATEPVWSTSGSVASGSVTFAPRAYYRPVASGPLLGEPV